MIRISLQGLTGISAQRRGTRPGGMCADIAFNLTMKKVLHKVLSRLRAEDLLPTIPSNHGTLWDSEGHYGDDLTIDPAAWVDDLVFFVAAQL